MGTVTPCPKDSPLMVAWEHYKATEEYANTKRWAVQETHTDGSLWEAFEAGFSARVERLERALTSIANNSCCEPCREAAMVARAALQKGGA